MESVRLLLQAGAPAQLGKGLQDVLHAACKSPLQSTNILHALLDAGADINAADASGMTTRCHAADSSRFDTMRVLLESGADVNLGTAAAEAAAAAAEAAAAADRARRREPGMFRMYSAHAASRKWQQSGTPLHFAVRRCAESGDTKGVQLLLDSGADCTSTDCCGGTPLHNACNHKRSAPHAVAAVQLLLAAGADMSQPEHPPAWQPYSTLELGKTAIAVAAWHGRDEVVSCMLSHPSSSSLPASALIAAATDAYMAHTLAYCMPDRGTVAAALQLIMTRLLAAAAGKDVTATQTAVSRLVSLEPMNIQGRGYALKAHRLGLAKAGLRGWLEASSVDLDKERRTTHTMISLSAQCARSDAAEPAPAAAAAPASAAADSSALGACCSELQQLLVAEHGRCAQPEHRT